MNSPFRPLVRLLSVHHWEAAKHDMKDSQMIEAGTSYDLQGNEEWKFYIVKNGDKLEKHTINVKTNYRKIEPYNVPPVPLFNATRKGTPRPSSKI